jgi:isoleucyl-tRNA synthetase
VASLAAPFAPFITERMWCDLNKMSGRHAEGSVHLAVFPKADPALIDSELEQMMSLAQQVSSMVLALRRKVNIKVRQPLTKIVVPVLDERMARRIEAVGNLITGEVNVKELELMTDTTGLIVKRMKPNFKTLGKRYGKQMKQIAAVVAALTQEDIARMERSESTTLVVEGETLAFDRDDFEVTSEDMPGWLVATEGALTVALDITVTDELRREGTARELVNRIQNLRKESGLEVVDKIAVEIEALPFIVESLASQSDYIAQQVLARSVTTAENPTGRFPQTVEIDEQQVRIAITKL